MPIYDGQHDSLIDTTEIRLNKMNYLEYTDLPKKSKVMNSSEIRNAYGIELA